MTNNFTISVSPHVTWRSTNALTNILAWLSSKVFGTACVCYKTVYKLIKVYTNDTCHQYAQVHLPLAY